MKSIDEISAYCAKINIDKGEDLDLHSLYEFINGTPPNEEQRQLLENTYKMYVESFEESYDSYDNYEDSSYD